MEVSRTALTSHRNLCVSIHNMNIALLTREAVTWLAPGPPPVCWACFNHPKLWAINSKVCEFTMHYFIFVIRPHHNQNLIVYTKEFQLLSVSTCTRTLYCWHHKMLATYITEHLTAVFNSLERDVPSNGKPDVEEESVMHSLMPCVLTIGGLSVFLWLLVYFLFPSGTATRK